MIVVPESVAFYLSDPSNRAAINLLVNRDVVPPDLSMAEVEQFEAAGLSAQRVRLEFWQWMRALWAASWDEAVRAAFPRARLASYGAHEAFTVDTVVPSVTVAWEEATTYGLIDLPSHGRLVTRLVVPDKTCRDFELGFYFVDAEGGWTLSDGLDLGAGWTPELGWRTSEPVRLVPGSEQGRLDPAPLREVAEIAVAALSQALA